ncbi:hypothetical protein [Streptomyces sp. NBC_01768]|uniref:hypothetical protein n=1 Tax=Streptomyces sp. NBC_01768 TaxID=2975938 RepID=UPI002DDAD038|nr:hypothetical protein [Streptomyces sp. NBC_01768]WSC32327.1 hypothetical protein OG902_39715 [Streptomyces sp. NBC_01768]
MSTRVPQRELKEQQKRVVELADTARANLTAHARSTDELRELGLMLGLIEVGPTGSLVTAYPWELDNAAVADGPDRCSNPSLR